MTITDDYGRQWSKHLLITSVGIFAALVGVSGRADEIDDVDDYLARLGLVEIRTLQLERQLDKESRAERKQVVARRLADLYADRMVNEGDVPGVMEDMSMRIERLLQSEPSAATKALDVAKLQGDYRAAEAAWNRWVADQREQESLHHARELFARIMPRLRALHADLQASVDAITAALDKASAIAVQDKLERELAREAAILARATFFAAWSSYYSAIVQPDHPESRDHLATAQSLFARLVDIELPIRYGDLKPEFMGLESVWRSRAWIGLAMAELAQGNAASADAIFTLLASSTTLPTVRDFIPFWHLNGFVFANRWKELLEWAPRASQQWSGATTPGRIAFYAGMLRAGIALRNQQPGGDWKTLVDTGVQGLSRMNQIASIQAILAPHDLPIGAEMGFSLLLAKARTLYQKAEQGSANGLNSTDSHRTAIIALELALANSREAPPQQAGTCHQMLGWCHYRLREWGQAARAFHQAADLLREHDPSAAADSAWMAFAAQQSRLAADPSARAAAIQALHYLMETFPDSPHRAKAEFQLTRLQTSDDMARIRQLEQLDVDHPNYLASRSDLCQAWYERWTKLQGQDGARHAAGKMIDSAHSYIDLLKTTRKKELNSSSVIRVAMQGAEVATSLGQVQDAVSFLQTIEPWISSLQAVQLAELHYRHIQLAQRTSDVPRMQSHVDALLEVGSGTEWELPGLLSAAKLLDVRRSESEARGSAASPASEENARVKRIYVRLIRILGDDPATLQNKNNARVVLAKLAQLESETKDSDSAAMHWRKLLDAFPQEQNYLRRGGKALAEVNDHARSLECWRKLLAGVEKGSDDWFEAKYYQLECLSVLDRVAARQVNDQFRLLFPMGAPTPWDRRFEEFESRLTIKK